MENQGGYYYDLFKFFSDNHGLTLIDSEIEDIMRAVDKFRDDKYYEAQAEADRQLEEDDEWALPDETCSACGCDSGEHMVGCPEDNSPYAQLCRDGYD
jgi:hypothetical protein